MPTEANAFITPRLPDAVDTNAVTYEPFASEAEREAAAHAWQHIIDEHLIEWGRKPDQLDEEGIQPPAPRTIARAAQVAGLLWKAGAPAPANVAPDTHGGIGFHWREGEIYQTYRITSDGYLDWSVFNDARLVSRQRVPFPITVRE